MKPKRLNQGDTIALIAPSGGLGGLFQHRVDNSIKALQKLGFKVKEYPTARKFVGGKAGTPEERVKDLMDAFKDSEVKAILCTIGGLCCNEILPLIDYEVIKKNPKIFLGYSDISLLHYAFLKKTGLTTFYGPAAMTQFGENPEPLEYTTKSFLKALTSDTPMGKVEASEKWTDELLDWSQKKDLERPRNLVKNEGYTWVKKGKVTGKIVGGCLYSILQLRGTDYLIDYSDKILFIETPEGQDFTKGEPLAYVDSQIMDLRNSGIFSKIKGLIVGKGFGYSEDERKQFLEMVKKHTNDCNFPVLFNVNIGHADPIMTLPLNVEVTLDSEKNLFSVNEAGVN